MIIKTLFNKKGQISLEFSILLLTILTISLATIYHFMNNNLNEREIDLDKIDIGAKTAISLVNAGYRGIDIEYPIIYIGMSYDSDKTNISIYIKNQSSLDSSILDFIESLIYERSDVDPGTYNITVITVD